MEQAVDWVVSKGVPFFLAAGNDGAARRHYSGTVNAHDSTGFIKINITGAGTDNTALIFNLVWRDGLLVHNGLTLNYYDSNQMPIADTTLYDVTESPRGTESQYSQYNQYVSSGNSTYYLKVKNPSAVSQSFHLYEYWNNGCVAFDTPDPNYTIAQPASADSAFAVGAFVSRTSWTASDNSTYSFGNTANDICAFSNRGPRIDGVQKPDIASPGSAIISLRDLMMGSVPGPTFVDNDGTLGGDAYYAVNQGTSMATPLCAGAAALLLNRYPNAGVSKIYSALINAAQSDSYTGSVPNAIWGAGKLNINRAIDDAALPVELVSFSAGRKDNSVLLEWKTATEARNYGFEVERSNSNGNKAVGNNLAWKKIGFVKGHGYSNVPVDYTFLDQTDIMVNETFYRLKQIDNDGSFVYSTTISVPAAPASFSLLQNFPNPCNGASVISFSVPHATRASIKIYSLLGQLLDEIAAGQYDAGIHKVKVNVTDYASGVYFYVLRTPEFQDMKKLILLK